MKRFAPVLLAVACLPSIVAALDGEAFERWAQTVGDRGRPLVYTGEHLKHGGS